MKDAADWHSAIADRFDSRYRDSAIFRERLDVWSELIKRYANPDGDTLDAGCGSGVLSFVAASCSRKVLAFDASPEMVRLARTKLEEPDAPGNVTFKDLRMEQLDSMAGQTFSLIISSSVLEYLEDFWGAMNGLADRLESGGKLVFSVPNMASYYRQLEAVVHKATGRPRYMAFVHSQPTDAEIRSGLAERGLQVIESRHFAPAPVLSKIARPLGFARRSDNLTVYVCSRAAVAAAHKGS